MSIKRRRVVKAVTPKTLLESKVSRANEMLKNLRKAGFKDNTWASKKLFNRLSNAKVNIINKKTGRINISGRSLNKSQTRIINKALMNFFQSETSTPEGIEGVRERTIQTLAESLSDPDLEEKVSYEDAEFFYDMLGDKDFDTLAQKVGASLLWYLIDNAIDAGDSQIDWLYRLQAHAIDIVDDDIKAAAIRVYEKYVI